MKRYLLFAAAAFALSPLALANELDNPNNLPAMTTAAKRAKPSADQIARAKDLPATVVIKIPISEMKKKNPRFEVAHVKDHIPAGKKVTHLAFEKMAMNSEVRGIAYDSGNELDKTTSTASWGFGFWGRPWIGPRFGFGWRSPWVGARVVAPGFVTGCGGCGGSPGFWGGFTRPVAPIQPLYSSWAYPSYSYAGYNYSYTPYYGFYDNSNYYAYCNWNPGFF